MTTMNLEQINTIIKGLPESASKLAPDDLIIQSLVSQFPAEVTEENKVAVIVSIVQLCYRLGTVFHRLAEEQEKLIEQWQNSQS